MARAYTPGLRVSADDVLLRERVLPLKGDVLVKEGDKVKAEDVIARTELPGNISIMKAANRLGVLPKELPKYMLKKEGDEVKKGEVIAEIRTFFGLFKSQLKSPIDGTIQTISTDTGQIIFQEHPIPVEVRAYVDSVVEEVMEQEGAVVKTRGVFIQGIFGIGSEAVGKLKVLVDSRSEELTLDKLRSAGDLSGCIVVSGSYTSKDVIYELRKRGAAGLITGGIGAKDLMDVLGYDIGVAVTGNENIGLVIVVTEGFGRIEMAEKTYRLLKENDGAKTSISGVTQIRAGVIRPEVVIVKSLEFEGKEELKSLTVANELKVGGKVRIIRQPYFGLIGEVVELPPEPQVIETETKVRVLKVRLADGREVVLPRANVEIIEEG